MKTITMAVDLIVTVPNDTDIDYLSCKIAKDTVTFSVRTKNNSAEELIADARLTDYATTQCFDDVNLGIYESEINA